MVAQEIWIDVNNHVAGDIVTRIGEGNSRQIVFKPFYYNDAGEKVQVVIDSENINGMFRMVKPDNTFVTTTLSLYVPSSNPAIFIATMTPAMSQVAGRGYYDIRIGDTEDASEFLYSAQGNFIIDDDMITDSMIESVAEVNGYVFPDDFLTSADLDDYVTDEELTDTLDDYATKEYVDDAIADIPSPISAYSTTPVKVGEWIDGKDVMEVVIDVGSLNLNTGSFATVNYTLPYGIKVISADGLTGVAGHGHGGGMQCVSLALYLANGNTWFTVVQNTGSNISGIKYLILKYIVA